MTDSLMARLAAVRKARGLTQKQVGEAMGIGQQHVSYLERGHGEPNLSTVRRYARAVGVVVRHEIVPDDTP